MSDLEAEVRDIKTRIENAQRAHARAEHERDAAQAAADQAATRLRDEFEVTDDASAAETQARLEQELATAVHRAERLLDEMGA